MSSLFRCFFCAHSFSEDRKPCTGTCTHTICLPCKEQYVDCPICDRPAAFKDTIINYAALDNLTRIRENAPGCEFWNSISTDNDFSGQCSCCHEYTKNLRICSDCAEKEELIERDEDRWKLKTTLCTLRTNFPKLKSRGFCANCGLDGEHKNHHIELLAKALKQMESKQFAEHFSKVTDAESMVWYMCKMWDSFAEKRKPRTTFSMSQSVRLVPSAPQVIKSVLLTDKEESLKTDMIEERRYLLEYELIYFLHQVTILCTTAAPTSEPLEKAMNELEKRWKQNPPPVLRVLTAADILRIDNNVLKLMEEYGSYEVYEIEKQRNIDLLALIDFRKPEEVRKYDESIEKASCKPRGS